MTAQIPEQITLDGIEMSMTSCPALPEGNLKELNENEIDGSGIIFSTACWRRYVGFWEIKDGKLYLFDIQGKYKLLSKQPIFASWFTGNLIVPKGNLLKYVHCGFGSIFEEEHHINIENGVVLRSEIIDNVKKHPELKDPPNSDKTNKLTWIISCILKFLQRFLFIIRRNDK